MSKGALGSYKKGIIDLYTMAFLIVISIVLLSWIYLFTKNKFSTIDFYQGELVFTNVLGTVTRVKKEEIKNITPLGLRIKNQIMPISFYYIKNNSELFFYLDEWKKIRSKNNTT